MCKRKEFQFSSSARCLCSMTFPVPFLFLQVIEGKLAPFLGKVIKFASSHVYSCSLCSQKGFICEICNNGEILYPFEDISTSRYRISSSKHTPQCVTCSLIWPDQTNFQSSTVSLVLSWVRFPLFLENVFTLWFSVFICNSPHYLYPE